MDTTDDRKWFQRRLEITDLIARETGAEFDAEILLCCAVSALAAQMWPGRRKDKQRFVQFLVDFAPVTRMIGVPLLANNLRQTDFSTAQAIRMSLPSILEGQILYGTRVDLDETQIHQQFPNIARDVIRSAAYATVMYVDLRCGLIHEIALGENLSSLGISNQPSIPVYWGPNDLPDEDIELMPVGGELAQVFDVERKPPELRWRLFFPYRYIRKIVADAATAAFTYWEQEKVLERPDPKPWWTDG